MPRAVLDSVGRALVTVPDNVKLHPSLVRIMKTKEEALASGMGLDWGTAEALAFGTLLLEGNGVRLSGQDVERGTFSHRHAVLHDQTSARTYTPLASLVPAGSPHARFDAVNSPLSEFGVMGFEVGYSMEDPNQLVMWEGQFGDFVNGAQIIIDQFLVAGETKWNRQCGLTLLLPHGFEGQGPEHSSARIERFLQVRGGGRTVATLLGGQGGGRRRWLQEGPGGGRRRVLFFCGRTTKQKIIGTC